MDEIEDDGTRCYCCSVDDPNEEGPYDDARHHVCVICLVKLRNLASISGGCMFPVGRGLVVTLKLERDPGDEGGGGGGRRKPVENREQPCC